MTPKIKVAFAPDWSKNNPYQALLAKSLAKECDIVMLDYPQGLRPFSNLNKQNPDINVLHLHWVAELIGRISWSKSNIAFYVKLALIALDIIRIKRKKVKLVWTIHNKFSHQGLNPKRELIIRRLLLRLVDKVILHSQEALIEVSELYGIDFSKKAVVIPHGNYDNCYPKPSDTRVKSKTNNNLPDHNLQILYFGSIRPYKGVDALIKAFNSVPQNNELKLLLTGNVPNKEYKKELTNLINNNPNIESDFNYISDQKLVNNLANADVVIIPFVDTLTSGSTILAMTSAKALILPQKAKIFGCVPDNGVIYFENQNELTQILSTLSTYDLDNMGVVNQKASKKLNWNIIARLTIETYKK